MEKIIIAIHSDSLKWVDPSNLKDGSLEGTNSASFRPGEAYQGYTALGEIEYDPANIRYYSKADVVKNAVAALQQEQIKIRAEAYDRCQLLETRIQQMLCIENGAEKVEDAE